MHTQIRQGDIMLIHVSPEPQAPKNMTKAKLNKLGAVIALGEVTGHSHIAVAEPVSYKPGEDLPVTPDDVKFQLGTTLEEWCENLRHEAVEKALDDVDMSVPACDLYLQSPGNEAQTGDVLVVHRPTVLRHEEHAAHMLGRGTWRIQRQQEFTPEGWRQVAD